MYLRSKACILESWNPFHFCSFVSMASLFVFFTRDTWGVRVAAISPLSLLRWRDVVTMECSIACQWRHSGWTEWSNGDEENRRGRGKMIGPCVDSQYSFTMAHSTHNMNFNKLWNLFKKKLSIKLQSMPIQHIWLNYATTYKHIQTQYVIEPNPLYGSHHHTQPYMHSVYAPRPLQHHQQKF